jgi:hypothetical protein
LNFRVLSAARLEAADAALWYEDQREGLGDDFLAMLDECFDRIRDAPLAFAALEQISVSDEFRRCLLERFPYVIIFRAGQRKCLWSP